MGQKRHYLTARQAAAALGVTPATLYSYASRGHLRSEPAPGSPRERRYFPEDIERLRERKEIRRDPAKGAARGLHWGAPVLDSGITLIRDGRLYYRGRDAVQLAETAGFEEAAELVWAAAPEEHQRLSAQASVLSASALVALRRCAKDQFAVMQSALPVAAAADPASFDLRPASVRLTGMRILRLLTTIASRRASPAPAHRALQAAWAPRDAAAGNAIRAALVLCADHELNVSAFTARCAASAAASPYDVVAAALATLKGHRHGGATERVAALFAEAETPRRARAAVAARLRRGERVPGFGHPLYPAGDPRAALLLRLAEAAGNGPEWRLVRAVGHAGRALLDDEPNLDFGLVALARAYRLPEPAPLLLFALGRAAGWIGHAIEQYAAGELIRPRARYTGPEPGEDAPAPAVPS